MERFFPPAQIPGGIDAPVFVRASAELTAPGRSARQRPPPLRRPRRHSGTDLRESAVPGSARPAADVRLVADRHRKRRNPQQRANVAMLKAGGKCSGFVRDRASRSRPQMSSAKSAEGVAHSRDTSAEPITFVSKYAADDRG